MDRVDSHRWRRLCKGVVKESNSIHLELPVSKQPGFFCEKRAQGLAGRRSKGMQIARSDCTHPGVKSAQQRPLRSSNRAAACRVRGPVGCNRAAPAGCGLGGGGALIPGICGRCCGRRRGRRRPWRDCRRISQRRSGHEGGWRTPGCREERRGGLARAGWPARGVQPSAA